MHTSGTMTAKTVKLYDTCWEAAFYETSGLQSRLAQYVHKYVAHGEPCIHVFEQLPAHMFVSFLHVREERRAVDRRACRLGRATRHVELLMWLPVSQTSTTRAPSTMNLGPPTPAFGTPSPGLRYPPCRRFGNSLPTFRDPLSYLSGQPC